MELWVPFVIMVLLLLARMPIAFAMALSGGLGLYMTLGFDGTISTFASGSYRHSASLLLTTVPMFILMAEFLSKSRIVPEIFDSAAAWTGRLRGGLAISAVLANTGFAALSGSSTAAAGSLARISVPQMRRHGYDDRLSVGTVASAGTFAATIPPSIALIIYGVVTETSVAQLFIAGIVPGIATAVLYIAAINVWVRLRPEIAGTRPEKVPLRTKLRATRRVWPALLLIGLIIVGIYSGAVTPTEAGGAGALAALIISVTVGGLRWTHFVEAVKDSLTVTAMILAVVIGAGIFGTYMSTTRITTRLFDAIENAGLPVAIVLGIIILLYIILGTFMDAIAMLVLTLPLTFPLAMELGFDAIWFGILVVKLAEIGLITPPLGLNVYVAASVSKTDIGVAFAGASRFVLVELLMVALLIAFPVVATFLPGLM